MKHIVFALFATLLSSGLTAQIVFEKTYGGSLNDYAASGQQTADGGYIVAGGTESFGAGGSDIYVVKMDAFGNTEWTETFGTVADEDAYSIQQTTDGGYIIGGQQTQGIYIVRIDSAAHHMWTQTLAGTTMGNVRQTSDGGYIVSGLMTRPNSSDNNLLLLKLKSSGDIQWTKMFGGSSEESNPFVVQTNSGSYVLCGSSSSFGGGNNSDVYLVKTDINGNLDWERVFDKTPNDIPYCVQQTSDGGYIIAGTTGTTPDSADVFLIKTNVNGYQEWGKTIGGAGAQQGKFVAQTSDGGYIITGSEFISNVERNHLVKTDSNGNTGWIKTLPGAQGVVDAFVQQTTDGGYFLCGYTYAADVYILKLDANGDSPVGIAKQPAVAATLIAYPNPADDFTTVTVRNFPSGNAAHLSLMVFDVLGKQVMLPQQINIGNNKASFKMETTTLPGGVYYYSVVNEHGTVGSGKLVVQ